MSDVTDPVKMVVIMRSDLIDLNPGKAVAQGTHAANMCIGQAYERFSRVSVNGEELGNLADEWEEQTPDSFGICVVLSGTYNQIDDVCDRAFEKGIHQGTVIDPSYPYRPYDNFWGEMFIASLVGSLGPLLIMPPGDLKAGLLLIIAMMTAVFLVKHVVAKAIHPDVAVMRAVTCGWVFGRASHLKPLTSHLRLMK